MLLGGVLRQDGSGWAAGGTSAAWCRADVMMSICCEMVWRVYRSLCGHGLCMGLHAAGEIRPVSRHGTWPGRNWGMVRQPFLSPA